MLAQLARDFQFLKCDPPACYRYYEGFRSGPAVTAEPREILLEGLIDMGSCALHDRLEPAERTGISFRTLVCPSAGKQRGRVTRLWG